MTACWWVGGRRLRCVGVECRSTRARGGKGFGAFGVGGEDLAVAVAELTGLLNLASWLKGMRVIARKERPHSSAQLRLTDVDGLRVTAFANHYRTAPGPGTAAPPLRPRDLSTWLGHVVVGIVESSTCGSGRSIQATAGCRGGSGGLRTNRSGWAA